VTYVPKEEKEGVNSSSEKPLHSFAYLLVGALALIIVTTVLLSLLGERILIYSGQTVERWAFSSMRDLIPGKPFPQGQRVLAKLVGREEAAKFRVLINCDEGINAFAVPGGSIVIMKELVEVLSTENALALVLGHEYGHFQNRDHLRGIGRGLGAAFALSLFGLDGIIVDFSDLGTNIFLRNFGREQERAADTIGLGLVSNAYGGLTGAEEFFTKIKEKGLDKNMEPSFMRTHPGSEERKERIVAEQGSKKKAKLLPLRFNLQKLCEQE
jgi:predicted Zn-dependent protease